MKSVLRRISTFVSLLARGNCALLRDRALVAARRLRLRAAGDKPFAYTRSGIRCVCHPGWPQSREGYCWAGEADTLELRLVRQWLQRGDRFLDVGTNLGLYSFAAVPRVGPDGGVVAVDAEARACEFLAVAFNLLEASWASTVHAAVQDQAGEVTFYISDNRLRNDLQSLRPNDAAKSKGMKAVKVPGLALRDLAIDALDGKCPSAIKLDIEGAEALALGGCPAEWLQPDGPLWIVEINPACLAEFGHEPADVLGFFSNGFECVLIPEFPNGSSSAKGPRWAGADETFSDAVFYNLVAIPTAEKWRKKAGAAKRLLGMAAA